MAFSQEETAKLPDHTGLLCISTKYYFLFFFISGSELKQWFYSPTPSWEPPLAAFFDVHGIFKKRGERNKMVRGVGAMVKSCRDEREKETRWQREECSQHGDHKAGRRWPRLGAVGLAGAAGAEGCRQRDAGTHLSGLGSFFRSREWRIILHFPMTASGREIPMPLNTSLSEAEHIKHPQQVMDEGCSSTLPASSHHLLSSSG